ncbi:MAG: hypothetical protein NZ845_05805 [Thermodesulfovibrio sp.]|nr:hypothetical protein [Thermodesulfovibrio sp.]MCX7723721.1 hypothetical protein [Thermodesulfovibrio sp.]MDW7998351.1 hypothetical protein [Thermodesulfovibrio sp.]
MEGRSRSFSAIVSDIAEGFITVNPLFLKKFSVKDLKELHETLIKKQRQIRSEPFPFNEPLLIRKRNIKLQRIHQAIVVVKNFMEGKI